MYITVITLAVFAAIPLVYGSFIRELVGKPDDVPPLDQALNEEWTEYKLSYNKTYQSAADERYRRYVWEDNLALINKHNREAAKGHQSYWMGVNQFTDMTSDEFISLMLPGDALLEFNATAEESDDDAWVTLPTSVDWRKKGLVTGVKNQGGCGSCWAFSTTGAIEGQHAKKTGKLLSLSEQELIDCSRGIGNRGCHGGWPITAYKYVIQNKGLDTESCYPYRAQDRKCSKKPSCIGATLKSYKKVPVGENNLQKAVAEVGPISVVVKFTSNFIHYRGGLYVDHTCNTSKTLHAILAVGYTPDYWIIKNSWGPGWGIQGYIHWARNRHNMCDVSSYASYPEAA